MCHKVTVKLLQLYIQGIQNNWQYLRPTRYGYFNRVVYQLSLCTALTAYRPAIRRSGLTWHTSGTHLHEIASTAYTACSPHRTVHSCREAPPFGMYHYGQGLPIFLNNIEMYIAKYFILPAAIAIPTCVSSYLNKKQPGYKKVRGQSEATMVI